MDSSSSTNSSSNYTMQVPELGKTLKKFSHILHKYVPHFTNANIITYFVSRIASDGLKVKDFKSMNSSAMNLFQCGQYNSFRLQSNCMTLKAQLQLTICELICCCCLSSVLSHQFLYSGQACIKWPHLFQQANNCSFFKRCGTRNNSTSKGALSFQFRGIAS